MYAFYDFETTGISPAYDQPLQFAAILTDDNFNEIKSVNIRCKLAPHILPSPIALAITKVSPRELLDQDFTLYEFALELAKLTSEWAPATWVGYNSLSFDENVMRHLFYQNLVPNIFRTQIDGNTRLDVMKLVMACWAFGSKALDIPVNEKGKQTIKLDQLAPLNGFDDHHAHDALGDVRATIHVAQIIRNKAPEIWNQVAANLNRAKLLNDLKSGRVYHFVDRFGASGVGVQTGVYCGTNSQNDKRIGFLNLAGKGIDSLLTADNSVIEKAVSASPLLIRSIDIGAMPLLFPANDVPADALQLAAQFSAQTELCERVGQMLAARYANLEPPSQVEDRIYEKFYSRADELKLSLFHKVPWEERAAILLEITDDRPRELGYRLLTIYAPESVDAETKHLFWDKIAKRWNGDEFYGTDAKSPGNTYASVDKSILEIESGGKFRLEAALLTEIREFYGKRRL